MNKQRKSLSISARRHFVDNFFFSKSGFIKGKIIDIGGKKTNKRGLFDIDKISPNVIYVNLEKKDNPDVIADARNIPLPDNSFDTVIMGELLEHVFDPAVVLKEAHRLLKPNGIILITVPFMVGVHGDPHDFGRYTTTFWEKLAEIIGFDVTEIEQHGNMFAVIALMVQHMFRAKNISWRPIQNTIISMLMWLDKKTQNPLLTAWTTGYGIILKKK